MAAPDLLRVRLLGGLSVEGLTEWELGSRKGRTLLKVLALARGEPVSVDRLVDALWSTDMPARPADQVGVLVARLRGVLGADRVVRTEGGYRLVADWLDVDELERRVEEAASAMAGGRVGAARISASSALALARSGLLPGDDAEWVLADRSRVAAQVARAHHLVSAAALAGGDHASAAASAEAALAHDAYDEAALRLLMRAHAGAGRPASALGAYVRVRDRLVEDLGTGPSAATEALHDELVLGGAPATGSPADSPVATGPRADGLSVPSMEPRRAGLVGRTAELARLEALLRAAAGGGPATLALVRGEAGIGKTTLVATWSGELAGRAVVLRGRCDELGRDLPLQPVADALNLHLRAVGLQEADRLLGEEAGIVGDLLGWSAGAGTATTVPDPAAGQARLFGALLAVTSRIGGSLPVLLVVEDLHLAGPSTLGWLAFARRRGQGFVVVATSRPPGPDLAGAEIIDLPPLTPGEAAELIGPATAERVAGLHARSNGNPLFILALAASADEAPHGVADARSFPGAPGGAAGSVELPRVVREVVRTQTASLGDAATTVQAAAVLGAQVDLDLLAEVLRRPAVHVLGELEAAERVGLLEERDGELAFRHELVRAALDQAAGSARRALVHRSAARALAGRPSEDPLTTAVHARLGGDTALAVDRYTRAAADALARFDTQAAQAHVESAMALGGSPSALIMRARVHMAALDFDRAAADAAQAVAHDGGAAALEIAAWVAYYQRRHEVARATALEGVAAAGDDAALRVSCLAVAGRVHHSTGDLAAAAACLASAHRAPAAVQGVADVWLAEVRIHEGEPAQALAALERPMADPERLAHPWAGLHGHFARAMALGQVGRLADALGQCDQLVAAVHRSGEVGTRFLAPADNVRGWLLRHSGSAEEGDAANQRAREQTRAPGGGPRSDAVAERYYVALLDLADGRLLADDLDGAADLLDQLAPVDRWSGTMAWHQRQRLGVLRARLALAAGDAAVAAQHASDVAADAVTRGTRRYELLARAWLALAGGEGDLERVAEVVEGLGGCAAIEAWRLTAALADHFGVDAWRKEARRSAAALVAASGGHAERLRSAVARVLD